MKLVTYIFRRATLALLTDLVGALSLFVLLYLAFGAIWVLQ